MANYKTGMTTEAYRAWLEKHNVSLIGASRFFRIGRTTSERWASGESKIPHIVAMLIECMDRLGEAPGSDYQRKTLTPDQRDERDRVGLELLAKGWQDRMDAKAEENAAAKAEAEKWQKRLQK